VKGSKVKMGESNQNGMEGILHPKDPKVKSSLKRRVH
jgi:hypothetical protein